MVKNARKTLVTIAASAFVLLCTAAVADPFRGAGGGLRAAASAGSTAGQDASIATAVRVLTSRDGNWQQQLQVQERQRAQNEAGIDTIASLRRADQESLVEDRERLEEEQQMHRARVLMQQQQKRQSGRTVSVSAADATLVADIQRALTSLGYWPGPIDGRLGTQTVIAIENYQTANNLLATGQPSWPLLRHMRAQGG